MNAESLEELERAYGRVTARFYDDAYEALSQARNDAGFYLDLAREQAGPVLELGCGTGRALLPIARAGFPCTGLDASQAMLDALRAKDPPPTLRLVRAPMQDFDLGEDRFTLAFAGFRVFQHLYEVEDQIACLACVKRHLAPGGAFAFDVFNPRLDGPDEIPEREQLRFEADGLPVVRYETVRRERLHQRLHVKMRYEVTRGDGSREGHTTEFWMRWFHRFELEHLLHRAGFTGLTWYGDFDRSPLVEGCPALIVVARV